MGIQLKITSFLCKMKSKVTIEVKNTAHPLHILLTVMEIFNAILFISSLKITTKIQILFIKHKQRLLITLKKTSQLWIRSSISLTAALNNIKIATNLLICVVISKISIWMLNGYSLQLVMASYHVMVFGDLLNVMLQNIVYKDPYMSKFSATNQCLIYVYEKFLPLNFVVQVRKKWSMFALTWRITFQSQRPCLEQGVTTILYQYFERKLLTNSQVRIKSFFSLISTNH